MKRLSFLIIFLSLTLLPRQIYAQENWVIDSFGSSVNVLSDGRVSIAETITVDFGSLQKHGIFRDIPYIYTDTSGEKTYTKIDILNVSDGFNSIPYEISSSGGYVQLKIGDPDKTISGQQTYRIEYTATGVLRSYETHDELFWDVTGSSWPVPISQASATVTLPSAVITKITCFEGISGSTNSCTSNQVSRSKATFATSRRLSTNEGFTVVVGYTKGLVPIIDVAPPPSVFSDLFSLPNALALVITAAVGIGFSFLMWWRRGRDYWIRKRYLGDSQAKHGARPIGAHETIVVEYEPPEKLRPAEIGTLIDEKAHTVDVTATIIDLASRGFLKIKEQPKKWLFGSTDYEFTRIKKDASNLLTYERELLDRIFDEGEVVKASDLKKEFYKDLKKVKEKLYEEMIKKRFFYENPEVVRKKYLFFGIGVGVLGGIFVFLGLILILSILLVFGIGVLLSGGVLMILSLFMPRKTAHGREIHRRIRGYQLFVSQTEKHRQKFFEKKNMFNEVLPYAIVFGVTEKFAKAFKDIGVEPQQPSWYTGTTPFNAAIFGASMSSFSNSLSSAMASTPGGSGFSGGGVGGGFGGGGGGSW